MWYEEHSIWCSARLKRQNGGRSSSTGCTSRPAKVARRSAAPMPCAASWLARSAMLSL
jgi:hypothetical protein